MTTTRLSQRVALPINAFHSSPQMGFGPQMGNAAGYAQYGGGGGAAQYGGGAATTASSAGSGGGGGAGKAMVADLDPASIPIAWWHRDDRYAERLAPGTKFADLIGEIDPAKILAGNVSLGSEDRERARKIVANLLELTQCSWRNKLPIF